MDRPMDRYLRKGLKNMQKSDMDHILRQFSLVNFTSCLSNMNLISPPSHLRHPTGRFPSLHHPPAPARQYRPIDLIATYLFIICLVHTQCSKSSRKKEKGLVAKYHSVAYDKHECLVKLLRASFE